MTWIATQSGHQIDFLNPDPDQILLMDIAVSMSRVARFGGHSPMKIGQHVIEVMHLMIRRAREEDLTFSLKELSEIALVGLIHDFPEYVVGDCMTPLKKLLGTAYEEIETRILNAMLNKWSLNKAYRKWEELLTWADREAVQQEATRFKLDGWLLTEEVEQTKIPNRWVPENKSVNLITGLIPEEDIQSLLTALFIRHMVLSDRFDLLSPHWQKFLTDAAAEDGVTIEEWVGMRLNEGSLFIDHPGYL